MYVGIDSATIKVDGDEIRELYNSLVRRVEHTIDTHWIQYPDSFNQYEQLSLQLIRSLAGYTGQDASEVIQGLEDRLKSSVDARGKEA